MARFLLLSLPGSHMDTVIWLMAQVFGLAGSTADVSPTAAPVAAAAVLEGRFMYPACATPADLVVCAEDRSTGVRHCGGPVSPGSDQFRLEVPSGRYAVYAESPAQRPGYRAFYNESVRCGLSVDCKDRSPVLVRAEAGTRVENINPADWFGAELEVLR